MEAKLKNKTGRIEARKSENLTIEIDRSRESKEIDIETKTGWNGKKEDGGAKDRSST